MTPIEWTGAVIVGAPLLVVFVYVIFRVGSLGVLKSMEQFKKGKHNGL